MEVGAPVPDEGRPTSSGPASARQLILDVEGSAAGATRPESRPTVGQRDGSRCHLFGGRHMLALCSRLDDHGGARQLVRDEGGDGLPASPHHRHGPGARRGTSLNTPQQVRPAERPAASKNPRSSLEGPFSHNTKRYTTLREAQCAGAARANHWRTTLDVSRWWRPKAGTDGSRLTAAEGSHVRNPFSLTSHINRCSDQPSASGFGRLRSHIGQSARARRPGRAAASVYRPLFDVVPSTRSGVGAAGEGQWPPTAGLQMQPETTCTRWAAICALGSPQVLAEGCVWRSAA